MRNTDAEKTSPCVKTCYIGSSGYCAGCGRSPDEIRDWSVMSPSERAKILEALESRPRRP